jgi:hypothetical protein
MNRRAPQPAGDSVVLTPATASAFTDGLLRMVHCFVMELPEPELRDVRSTLDILMMKVDQILDNTEHDLSLNFDNLTIDPGKPHRSCLTLLLPIFPSRTFEHTWGLKISVQF